MVSEKITALGSLKRASTAVVILPAVVNLNSFSTALVVLLVVKLNIRAGLSYGPDTQQSRDYGNDFEDEPRSLISFHLQ